VAPVYLKDPVRIEGLPCCRFFALIVQSLIEHEIRGAMKAVNTGAIALYPELRDFPSPNADTHPRNLLQSVTTRAARWLSADHQDLPAKTRSPATTGLGVLGHTGIRLYPGELNAQVKCEISLAECAERECQEFF